MQGKALLPSADGQVLAATKAEPLAEPATLTTLRGTKSFAFNPT
ncbi:MAG: hypothetical protein Q7U47_15930 [Paludibacter sp.]|nr:hypothetical protein [Paludibacter sp.]